MTLIEQPGLAFRVEAYPVPREAIFEQPSFNGAMNLALSLCNFTNDKQAANKLGIDPGLFSRRKSGQAPWQVEDMRAVIDRSQTLLPLSWLAHQYGHGLYLLETEAERREKAAQARIAELEFKNRVLVEALHGRVA